MIEILLSYKVREKPQSLHHTIAFLMMAMYCNVMHVVDTFLTSTHDDLYQFYPELNDYCAATVLCLFCFQIASRSPS